MEELCVEGLATTATPSHASTTHEDVAERWQGHVQAGLSSREITILTWAKTRTNRSLSARSPGSLRSQAA
jgi:hypothetical protein